jgi:hypothetical protein
MKKHLLLLVLSLTFFTLSKAATVTWDGGASTSNWTDPLNWSTNSLPTAADEAYISGATVTLTGSTLVQRVYTTGSATITINAGAVLTISGSTTGVDAFQIQNSVNFTNNGTINITSVSGNSGADGLLSKGMFTNNGTININGIAQHGLYLQGGTFTNAATGSISITNVGQATTSGDGIYADDNGGIASTLVNNGTITVSMTTGDDGIYINDTSVVVNNSIITLSGTLNSDNGIRIDDKGTFDNAVGGTLTINATPDDQLFLDLTGQFINSGTVNINNGLDVGLYVTDNSLFTNNATGVVNVSNTSNYAIQIDASTTLSALIANDGAINTTGGKDGLRLQNKGNFINASTGVFTITNAAEDGINFQTSGGTFNNSGIINMTNSTQEGIDMAGGTFINLASGQINAIDCAQDNIEVEGTSIFNNYGFLKLNRTTDGVGRDDIEIITGGTFNNFSTATFAPGLSPGELEVRGLFDLGASTTTFEINGTSNTSQYDRIEKADGSTVLTISSANAILDWGSFIPALNDTFRIVDGGGLVSGTFASVTDANPAITYIVDYSEPSEVRIVITATPLPVDLLNFTGAQVEKGIQLLWSTQNEMNNKGFELERSSNSADWKQVTFLNGGEDHSQNNYSFIDLSPTDGINYYRLKQLDFDGRFNYSKVISVNYENQKVEYSFYPNPVEDLLHIKANKEESNLELKLLDISGKILWSGNNIQPISLKEFSTGIYFLEIKSPLNQSIHKIFKK